MIRLAGGYRRPPKRIEFSLLATALERFRSEFVDGSAAPGDPAPPVAAAEPLRDPDRR